VVAKRLPSFWKADQSQLDGVKEIQEGRYGILASIPMICKGSKCPFYEACYLDKQNLPVKSRCPIEIQTLVDRFDRYCNQLKVDEDNLVDLTLVRELCDIDIQLTRAEMRLAISADFVEDVIVAVDQNGTPHYRPELNKAVEYKDKLRKERHRILELLASTRKQKDVIEKNDPSTLAAALFARMQAAPLTAAKPEGSER
jgi:hypothetical protein